MLSGGPPRPGWGASATSPGGFPDDERERVGLDDASRRAVDFVGAGGRQGARAVAADDGSRARRERGVEGGGGAGREVPDAEKVEELAAGRVVVAVAVGDEAGRDDVAGPRSRVRDRDAKDRGVVRALEARRAGERDREGRVAQAVAEAPERLDEGFVEEAIGPPGRRAHVHVRVLGEAAVRDPGRGQGASRIGDAQEDVDEGDAAVFAAVARGDDGDRGGFERLDRFIAAFRRRMEGAFRQQLEFEEIFGVDSYEMAGGDARATGRRPTRLFPYCLRIRV